MKEPSLEDIDKLSQNLKETIEETAKLTLIKYTEKCELFSIEF